MPEKTEGIVSRTALTESKMSRINELIIQQKMVLIPAGEFVMGNNGRGTTDGPGDPDETPVHRVFVDAFYIDQYETTNSMYQEFVRATSRHSPKHWKGKSYPEGKANHPVVYVDWYDANAFCQWAKKRLPTEEEWEKAARGTDGRIFPWGSAYSNDRANTPQYWLAKGVSEDNLGLKGGTLPVGSFENGKSRYGLYDMAGNVYEWTSSWYLPYPGNKVWNIHYGNKNKVLRGGSWYDCLSYGCGLSAPTYNRSRFSPEIKNMGFGFRCAKSLR
jgi:formylglycine-generating enzyme required for sulfatase activity